ncbi:MAG: 30S ribosomal protein S12 methylthiotransferase RimO [Planctomycetes bacterium]|nr:30S ribosomal protein S12 methylthiotransferase RimO [Planctomycetota bacterium]
MPRKLPTAQKKKPPAPKKAPRARPARVGVISLGCPKNMVDTEVLLGRVAEEHVICADPADADVVIVNTCGFIDQARDESLAVIREMAELKAAGKLQGLVVAGCLAQRWGDKLREEAPGIDSVLGMAEYGQINTVLKKVLTARDLAERARAPWRTLVADDPTFAVEAQTGRLRVTPPHYAYLQVSEGCDNACTFCSIPTFRGLFRSKPRAAVLAEAEELAASGALELNLISQDTTDWGKDLPGEEKHGLAGLLPDLAAIDGVRWLRLLYAYPGHVSDGLIAALRELQPKVVPYLDMPIQHIDTQMLKRMGRRHTREQTRALLEKLRAEVPGLVLRTTFIVGFPGETEARFQQLVDFVDEFRFERVGAFPYSHEPDTPAGEHFEDDVPAEVKAERVARLMEAQQPIAFEHARRLVGREVDVLVEGVDAETGKLVGRTPYDAPEIDPHVRIGGRRKAAPGTLARAKITKADGYDVVAELLAR